MFKNIIKKNKGFTLIEILVVIGIIAILAAIVIIAINPARQFAQARNTQRTANVNAILNAIGQNTADYKGIFTCSGSTLDATKRTICSTAGSGGCPLAASMTDLGCLVPTYIPALPVDPNGGNYQWTDSGNYNTGYTVQIENNRTKVCAPHSVESALGNPTEICVIR